jgi:hypothetical protein
VDEHLPDSLEEDDASDLGEEAEDEELQDEQQEVVNKKDPLASEVQQRMLVESKLHFIILKHYLDNWLLWQEIAMTHQNG